MGKRARLKVDPRTLRLTGIRMNGADPGKLQRQIAQYGKSQQGMPPIEVSRCPDGHLVIRDGVTRATRIAKLCPGDLVTVEVASYRQKSAANLPTVGDRIP